MLHRIFIVSIIIITTGCQGRNLNGLQENILPQKGKVEDNSISCLVPPTNFENIGFVNKLDGLLCRDLFLDDAGLKCFITDTGFDPLDPNIYYKDIDSDQKKWLLNYFGIKPGEQWSLIKPGDCIIENIRLSDITWNARERCSTPTVIFDKKEIVEKNPLERWKGSDGLAFPGCHHIVEGHQSTVSKDVISNLKQKLREDLYFYRLETVYPVYWARNEEPIYLVVFNYGYYRLIRIYDRDYTNCKIDKVLYNHQEMDSSRTYTYQQLDNSLIIEDMEEHDVGLWDTDVYVICDLDGDGGNEVYIDTDIPALFSVRKGDDGQPVFAEIMTYYCGP